MSRLVIFASSDTGYLCTEALVRDGQQIVGMVTAPQTLPDGRVNCRFRDMGAFARLHEIPLLDGSLESLAAVSADLFVVVGWYQFIPVEIRTLPRLGTVGIHASLLPQGRGGAPLVWAMINGQTETGVTLFHLTDEMDAGDVIGQLRIPIGAGESISTVVDRANRAAVYLVREYVPFAIGRHVPQNHAHATVYPQRCPEDGRIPRGLSTNQTYDWIRAQSDPYPGAFVLTEDGTLYLWRTDQPDATVRPLGLSSRDGWAWLGCHDGALRLRELSRANGPRIRDDACGPLVEYRHVLAPEPR